MIKANNYSTEPNKELKVTKTRLENLSLFSQAKEGRCSDPSALSRCSGERMDQHGEGEELKDSGQKTKRVQAGQG